MTTFLQQLVNGLSLGSIYALIALGYTMVYGVLRLINFAHGDVYMVGAYVGYYLSRRLQGGGPSLVSALVVMLGSMIACGLLGILIERLAYRPVRREARLMGISTDWIIAVTFALGSALAAAAGVLIGMQIPKIDPLMGIMYGLKAFVAAVLGGIGSVPGAVLGGLLIGTSEVMVVGYLSSTYRDAIAFGILILVLLLRPQGILGKVQKEKV